MGVLVRRVRAWARQVAASNVLRLRMVIGNCAHIVACFQRLESAEPPHPLTKSRPLTATCRVSYRRSPTLLRLNNGMA